MAKLSILAGSTSQSVNIFINDSSVSTGAGLTGLAYNTSSLIAYYAFNGANGGSNLITLESLSTPTDVYTSGGFIAVDGTNMPGLYRFDIPDTTLAATEGRSVVIMLSGATNMAPVLLEIELTAVDNQSTAFGLSLTKTTNITGFNDIASTSIVSSGPINTSSGAVSTVSSVSGTVGGIAGVTFPSIVASPTNITGGTIGTVTNPVTVGSINSGAAIFKINTAFNNFIFQMVDNIYYLPLTGLIVTSLVSLNGSDTFLPTSFVATEMGNGWYTINLSASDLNGSTVALMFTAPGAAPTNLSITTQP